MMEGDERHFQRYFEALRRWGTPEELERVLQWCTPEELTAMMDAAGTPQEAAVMIRAVKERAADWAWALTTRRKLGAASKLVLLVGAIAAVAQPLLQRLLEWWRG